MIGVRTLEAHQSPGLDHFLWAARTLEPLTDSWFRGFEPTRFNLQVTREAKPDRYATNLLVHACLKSDCDWLWLVDSNCEPSKESFDLLRVDADIIGGLVPVARPDRKRAEGPPYDWSAYRRTNEMLPFGVCGYEAIPAAELAGSRVIEVDAVGTACMLVSRSVLTVMAAGLESDPHGVVGLFQAPEYPSGLFKLTPDLDFCMRAKALGYTIKAHTGVRWDTSRRMRVGELARQAGDEAPLLAGDRNVDAA